MGFIWMILWILQLHLVNLHDILDMMTAIDVFEEHVPLLVVEYIFALVVKRRGRNFMLC